MILEFLQNNPCAFLITLGVFGAIIGSFLNVVIYRLPIMLQREWKMQCEELLNLQSTALDEKPFNLFVPRSQCPHCHTLIKGYNNIPLLSYLLLRGKCANCRQSIAVRYPIIELVTALLSIAIGIHYGFHPITVAALIFTWSLICLSVIDFDHQILPDDITLSLLWVGLLCNLFTFFIDINAAVMGAVAGYMSLWLVAKLFKLIAHKEGMGQGDFKLFAALGAWLGWQLLPFVIILASFLGVIIGLPWLLINRKNHSTPIPFGPFLAIAGWIALQWGNELTSLYFNFFRF